MVKNKKGLSVVIGYVLLISLGVIMSVIVFTYLKSYVPKDLTSCPEGSSLFLDDYSCSSGQLNISMKNNGKFNLGGFFILGGNNSEGQLATYDLSRYLQDPDGRLYGNAVVVNLGEQNLFHPNDKNGYIFNIGGAILGLNAIEIIPMRFEEDRGKMRLVTCSSSKIREEISCS
jgi:hypothetical protein